MRLFFGSVLCVAFLGLIRVTFALEAPAALQQGDAYGAVLICKKQVIEQRSVAARRCLFEAAAGAGDWTLADRQWQQLEDANLAQQWQKELAWWRGLWDKLRVYPSPERVDKADEAAVLLAHLLVQDGSSLNPQEAAIPQPWQAAVTVELMLPASPWSPDKTLALVRQQADAWPIPLGQGIGRRWERLHPESAWQYWQAWLAVHPRDRFAQRHLIEWALNDGRLTLASTWLDKLTSRDWPDRYLWARYQLQIGKVSEAERLLEHLQKEAPDHLNTRWFLSLAQFRLHKDERALKTLQPVVDSRPLWLPARRLQLQILLRTRQWKEAWRVADDLQQQGLHDGAIGLMAVVSAVKTGHLPQALKWLEASEEAKAGVWSEEWTRLASEVYVLAEGRLPDNWVSRLPWWDALNRYRDIPEASEPEVWQQWPMEKRLAVAWRSMKAGKLDMARELLPPLPNDLQDAPDLWLRLHAELAVRSGQKERAKTQLAVLRSRHRNDAALCVKALQLEVDTAMSDWTQCWQLNPNDRVATEAYLSRLLQEQQWQEAGKVVRYWQEHWPEWPMTWRRSAQLELARGKPDAALAAVRQLAHRAPTDAHLDVLYKSWLELVCQDSSTSLELLVQTLASPLWPGQQAVLLQHGQDAPGRACLVRATQAAPRQTWNQWSPEEIRAWAQQLASTPAEQALPALTKLALARPDVPEVAHLAALLVRHHRGKEAAHQYLLDFLQGQGKQALDAPWRDWLAEIDAD